MCRAEADRLYARRAELEAVGARLLCTVKEEFRDEKEVAKDAAAPTEVEKFRAAVWPGGEVFLDADLAFYKAVGGGATLRTSLASFLGKLANPFSLMNTLMKVGERTFPLSPRNVPSL